MVLQTRRFIQQLDDIAFSLAKMDVLGKRLQRACTAKLFQTEFEKQKLGRMSMRNSLRRGNRRASIFLKSIYFFNLVALLGGMLYVSIRQTSGYYQCEVRFDSTPIMFAMLSFYLSSQLFVCVFRASPPIGVRKFGKTRSLKDEAIRRLLCLLTLTESTRKMARMLAVQCTRKDGSLTGQSMKM